MSILSDHPPAVQPSPVPVSTANVPERTRDWLEYRIGNAASIVREHSGLSRAIVAQMIRETADAWEGRR
jgi:hypothetical protein